jgi:hypothetical protein
LPGFARASAISSCRVFAGSAGFTMIDVGVVLTMPIAMKSFTAS